MTHQVYLFVFLLIYFFIVVVLRSFILWKNTGLSPINTKSIKDKHSQNERQFLLITIVELVVISIYTFFPEWYENLLPFEVLENEYLLNIGWVILHISLVWIFVAQLQMSDSWRIGIDTENKSKLVTNGLFIVSRNPIFFGIMVTNFGLFLVIPNLIVLIIFFWSYWVIRTQILLEESYLKREHGEAFEKYCQRVRRWI